MSESKESQEVLAALETALIPLAEPLISAGFGYREVAETLKAAFVRVTTDKYGKRGRPANISRVSSLTEISRKEVKRIRDNLGSPTNDYVAQVIPSAHALNTWHTDSRFLDDSGRPLELEIRSGDPNFEHIAKSIDTSVSAETMLSQLIASRAVDTDGKLYWPVRRYYRSPEQLSKLKQHFEFSLACLNSTYNHNFHDKNGDTWIERVAFSHNAPQSGLGRMRRVSRDRCDDFINSINEIFSPYEDAKQAEADDSIGRTIGVGVYYFERDDWESD